MVNQSKILASLGLLAAFGLPAHAQNLLQNGDFAKKTDSWVLPNPQKAAASVVETTGAGPNTKALRFQITPVEGENPWSIVLRQPLQTPFKTGDALLFKAWLRSPQRLKTFAFLEAKDEKYTKSLEKPLELTPEWKEYEVRGPAKGDYAAGETSLGFHLGFGAGTIEMAGLQLLTGAAAANAPVAVTKLEPLPLPPTVVANGSLVPNGEFAAPIQGNWEGRGAPVPTLSLVPATGAGDFKTALRIETKPVEGANSWSVRVAASKIATTLKKGDLVAVRLWARSPDGNRMTVIFQQAADPYNKTISQKVSPTREWKEYTFYSPTPTDWAGEVNFELHVGYQPGTLEIAGVRVESMGQTTPEEAAQKIGPQSVDYWGGQKPNDLWKKAAFERIEKHRKGDLKLRVVDAKGKPIPGAKIKLAQTRQLFRWGSAVVAARLLDTTNADNLRYQSEVERLFNTVVFENDLKWSNKNPKKTELALEALKWIQARNMPVRGHTLVWGDRRNLPAEAAALWDKPEELRALVRKRVREQATAFKGQLYVWDVVNEAVTNRELWDLLGWEEFANAFKIAREVDPNVRLAYNDYNIANEYENPGVNRAQRVRIAELIGILRKNGAPVDIYGDQAHFGVPITMPSRMVEIWDEAAKVGLPIELTELDAGIGDDKLHGEFIRDVLIAAFSSPKVEAVIMWGFWEGAHWRGKEGGAMFRRDWSKRPAQEAYEKLVLNDWMTKMDTQTAKDGVLQTRGFLGDYSVLIEANGKSRAFPLKLGKEGARVQIAL